MGENIFESIKKEEILLPLQILDSYANSFNETFKGNLVFETKRKLEDTSDPWSGLGVSLANKEQEEKDMVVRAYIIAPGLNNYRLLVMKLVYKVSQVYPCSIENILEDKTAECKDADSVKKCLEEIFKAQSFQRPVKMLLSQL